MLPILIRNHWGLTTIVKVRYSDESKEYLKQNVNYKKYCKNNRQNINYFGN
jgi:hypothetical protein